MSSTDSGYPIREGGYRPHRSPVPRVDVELFDDEQSNTKDVLNVSSFDSACDSSYCIHSPNDNSYDMSGPFSDEEWVPPDADLQRKIMDQMDVLFSDENLLRDAFLRKHVLKNKDGFVNIKLITSFKRIKCLTKDWRTVAYSIYHDKNSCFLINSEKTKVKRLEALPDFEETATPSRSVIALNLPPNNSSIENVGELFSPCGEIASVRIFRPGRPLPNEVRRLVQGCNRALDTLSVAVIEFETPESARCAVELSNQNAAVGCLIVEELPSKKSSSSAAHKKRKRIEEKRQLFVNSRSNAITESTHGRQFCKVVGGYGQLSLPQERGGVLSGGSSESVSSCGEYTGSGSSYFPYSPNLLSPASHNSFQSTPCSSPCDVGSTDHLSASSAFFGSHSNSGHWLSPTPSNDSMSSSRRSPGSRGDNSKPPAGQRRSDYPVYNWSAAHAHHEGPLFERRYSDIPVHRNPSAEVDNLLSISDAWKRTSYSLDQQHAALGRSDSQLLQLTSMCSLQDPPLLSSTSANVSSTVGGNIGATSAAAAAGGGGIFYNIQTSRSDGSFLPHPMGGMPPLNPHNMRPQMPDMEPCLSHRVSPPSHHSGSPAGSSFAPSPGDPLVVSGSSRPLQQPVGSRSPHPASQQCQPSHQSLSPQQSQGGGSPRVPSPASLPSLQPQQVQCAPQPPSRIELRDPPQGLAAAAAASASSDIRINERR